MGCKISFFFFFLSVLIALEFSTNTAAISKTVNISRTSFPSGFIFGVSSAAYQYEGAANEGGRGSSIWDTFVHKYPEKITGGATGDVAEDQYHRYKEDVKLMKSLGMQAYRFSISWTRILPSGRTKDGRNSEGIKYYNNLINELLSHGIQPFITLFHWDVPQMLEDEYGGFRNSKIVEDYLNYVEVCFKEFGERVKHWTTLNEPYVFSVYGYGSGVNAPGRCSKAVNQNCTGGNSATEPYMVGHNLLLAHAAVVKLYRDKYKKQQKGEIGITLSADWHLPYSNSSKDSDATQRETDFDIGWFLDPLVFGQYPKSMKSLVGQRLPKFTKEQSQQLKGSFDFVGINYYTTNYVMNNQSSNANIVSVSTDPRTATTGIRNGVPIGPVAASPWLYVYPKGLEALMVYLKKRYNNPKIYITENGYSDPNYNNSSMLEKSLKDSERTYFHSAHLSYLQQAIREGANVHGYFAWTFLDDFEWSSGYSVRFGLVYVDFNDGLKRYPKNSALWFKKFLT